MSDDRPITFIPDMCQAHQGELVHRLGVPESGPWPETVLVAQLLLFRRAIENPVVVQRCRVTEDGKRDASDLSLVFAEIGCLACFDRKAFNRALHLIRKRGLHHAAAVARGEGSEEADG